MSANTLAERVRERAKEAFKCDMCAGSGQIMFYGRNFGSCTRCQGAGEDTEAADKAAAFALSELSAAEQAVRKDEREQCCKDVCVYCKANVPVKTIESLSFMHEVNGNGVQCYAAAIRNRE